MTTASAAVAASVAEEPELPAEAVTHHPSRQRHFLRVAILGLITGLFAIGFQYAIFAVHSIRENWLEHLHAHPIWGWAILPLIGLLLGSVAGLMVYKIEPDAAGSGIPHVKGVLLGLRQMRWVRVLFVKFIGGLFAFAAGVSAGREGPTVQIGAALGDGMGRLLHERPRVRNQLMTCGAGAGLAAAFNAPLAGFIFVIEELRREMSPTTYGGALIAAVCADVVTRYLTGQLPSFHVKIDSGAMPLSALPAIIILGVIVGFLCVLWNRNILMGRRIVAKSGRVMPRWLVPGIVAATCGLVAWWLPVTGAGTEEAQRLLSGDNIVNGSPLIPTTIGVLIALLFFKYVLTVASFSSGVPGGIFAPMLLMGAIAGALVSRPFGAHLGVDERAMAVLGMAAWFSGSVRAPLTGIVLMLEMTGDYNQLFALAVVSLTAYLVAEGLHDAPVYDALLEMDIAAAHGHAETAGEAVPVTMGIQHGSHLEGITLREAKFPSGCLVVALERRGQELIPTVATRLEAGDHITVLTPSEKPDAALAVVELCRGR